MTLIALIWFGISSRTHQQLSLRPFLSPYSHSEDGMLFSETITNAGQGVAIISKFTITYNNKQYDNLREFIISFVSENGITDEILSKTSISSVEKWNTQFAIGVGESKLLYKIDFSKAIHSLNHAE